MQDEDLTRRRDGGRPGAAVEHGHLTEVGPGTERVDLRSPDGHRRGPFRHDEEALPGVAFPHQLASALVPDTRGGPEHAHEVTPGQTREKRDRVERLEMLGPDPQEADRGRDDHHKEDDARYHPGAH